MTPTGMPGLVNIDFPCNEDAAAGGVPQLSDL